MLQNIIVSEVSPDYYRGIFGSFHQCGITIGCLASYIVSLTLKSGTTDELSKSSSWRVAMAVPSFFSFVQLVTMFTLFLHETPQWYFYNDKPQEVFYTIILIT